MKIRFLMMCGAISAGLFAACAAEETATKPATPVAEPVPVVITELKALVEKVRGKLETGAQTEAALAEELQAFDALLAAHANERTDDVAQVVLMKARLYVQVIGDFDKGADTLRRIKTDFPATQAAARVDEMLAQLEGQKKAAALQATLVPGAVFPDFQETDLAGNPLSIGGLKGKVVLVDFWATWCGPCVGELPNVIAAYEKYHAKGFEVVGISLDRSEDALKKFIAERKMTWPQYFDGKAWDSKLGRQYGITSIPATYLLDREGRIVARDLRGEALETELARLFGE